MKRMNKKKLAIFCLAVIWFAFSTKILTGIYNRNAEITKSVEIPYLDAPIGYHCVDDFYCTDDIFSSVNISGWAVYPDATEEAKIYLYLESPRCQYKIGTQSVQRIDILTLLDAWGVPVQGDDHGFTAAFSPYFMKNGEYELYVLSQVGDKLVGMSRANYVVKKDMKQVLIEKSTSSRVEKIVPEDTIKMQRWVDYILEEDGMLKIGGWILFPGVTNEYRESYIGIAADGREETFYKAVTSCKLSLLNMTQESYCREAGFEVEIPLEDLGNLESGYLNFYVKSGGKYYKAKDGWEFTVQ